MDETVDKRHTEVSNLLKRFAQWQAAYASEVSEARASGTPDVLELLAGVEKRPGLSERTTALATEFEAAEKATAAAKAEIEVRRCLRPPRAPPPPPPPPHAPLRRTTKK